MDRTTRIVLCVGLLAALRCAAWAAEGGRPTPEDIAAGNVKLARVNAHAITRMELDKFFNGFFLDDEGRRQLDAMPILQRQQALSEGRSKALRELIDRRLLLDEARDSFLGNENTRKILEEMVSKQVREAEERAGSTVTFVARLHQRGITLNDWRAFTSDTILIQNYIWEKAKAELHVRPDEIRRYYDAHKNEFVLPRRIAYRVILVDPTGCTSLEEERVRAEDVLRAVGEGGDFAALADLYSLERDKVKGGLHEVDAPPAMPDWLPRLCEGLEPGDVSGLRETDAGFCITKLERVEPGRPCTFREAQERVRDALLERAREDARELLLARLRESAHLELYAEGEKLLGISGGR